MSDDRELRSEVAPPEITQEEMLEVLEAEIVAVEKLNRQAADLGLMTEYQADREVLVLRQARQELELWFEAKRKLR